MQPVILNNLVMGACKNEPFNQSKMLLLDKYYFSFTRDRRTNLSTCVTMHTCVLSIILAVKQGSLTLCFRHMDHLHKWHLDVH